MTGLWLQEQSNSMTTRLLATLEALQTQRCSLMCLSPSALKGRVIESGIGQNDQKWCDTPRLDILAVL